MPVSLGRVFHTLNPADGSGIEDNLGSCQGNRSRCLREPLVIADEDGKFRIARIINPDLFARREVALLEKERIVGNMDLAIGLENAAIAVDHGS